MWLVNLKAPARTAQCHTACKEIVRCNQIRDDCVKSQYYAVPIRTNVLVTSQGCLELKSTFLGGPNRRAKDASLKLRKLSPSKRMSSDESLEIHTQKSPAHRALVPMHPPLTRNIQRQTKTSRLRPGLQVSGDRLGHEADTSAKNLCGAMCQNNEDSGS